MLLARALMCLLAGWSLIWACQRQALFVTVPSSNILLMCVLRQALMSNRLLNQVGIAHLSAQLYVYNIGMSTVVLKV